MSAGVALALVGDIFEATNITVRVSAYYFHANV